MKKILFVIILIIIIIGFLSGCVKKERWTWDEKGPGKDEWYEPGIPEDTPGFELLLLVVAAGIIIRIKKRWLGKNN